METVASSRAHHFTVAQKLVRILIRVSEHSSHTVSIMRHANISIRLRHGS